jgi:DNA-binding NarL/FixJ family response regulator
VDDQAIVRKGIVSMLSPEPDIMVVGEAGDGLQASDKVMALHPDIVLMDVRMPGLDGLGALQRIKELSPRTSVIMVTLYDDPTYLIQAVASGAAGYILKDSSRNELLRAVRVTAQGGAIIDSNMLPGLLSHVSEVISPALARQAGVHLDQPLSGREIQVLRLVAEGLTNADIAERLVISPTTVKSHVQNILQKLEVSDRTQAAVHAVRRGLI